MLRQKLESLASANHELEKSMRHFIHFGPSHIKDKRIKELEQRCIAYSNSEVDYKSQIEEYRLQQDAHHYQYERKT